MTPAVNLELPALRARLGEARGVFVTGTDTGVGKTVFSSALARALVR